MALIERAQVGAKRSYTFEDDKKILEMYGKVKVKEIAEGLDRSVPSVRYRVRWLLEFCEQFEVKNKREATMEDLKKIH